MAGYGYANRGYTDDWNKKSYGEYGYPKSYGENGYPKTTDDWFPKSTDDWNKKRYGESGYPKSYGESGYPKSYSYSPKPVPESYITTSTERFVEHGRTPIEPVKDYGYTNDKWRSPSSPNQDRLQRVEEFNSNVQFEANRGATRPGFPSVTNWRSPPYSGTGTGYGEHTNYRKNDSFTEPAVISQDGWERERSGQKVWATPAGHDTQISGPTNDIGKAVEILKEAAKTSPVTVATTIAQPWLGPAPASTVPKRDTYTNNTASRYGNFNLSSRQY